MTDKNRSPRITALQELEAALHVHRREQAEAAARDEGLSRHSEPIWRRWGLHGLGRDLLARPRWRLPFNPWLMLEWRHPLVRKVAIVAAAVVAVLVIGGGALVWRLASGPIMLDLATPWLTAAIEANFGNR
jgi:hypothetical protein